MNRRLFTCSVEGMNVLQLRIGEYRLHYTQCGMTTRCSCVWLSLHLVFAWPFFAFYYCIKSKPIARRVMVAAFGLSEFVVSQMISFCNRMDELTLKLFAFEL